MKKREKQKQQARLKRLQKIGLTDQDIFEVIGRMSEDDLKKLLKRIKKRGIL